MAPPRQPHSPPPPERHRIDEPDIGSGERSPGQHDTDKMIEQVPGTPPTPPATPPAPDAPSSGRR